MFQVPREEHSEYLNNLYKGQEDHTIPSYGSSISSLFQHIRLVQQQGQNNTALYVCTQNPFGSNMWLFYQRNSASFLFSSCPGFTPLHCQPLLSLLTAWGHPKEYQGWKTKATQCLQLRTCWPPDSLSRRAELYIINTQVYYISRSLWILLLQ